jgi:hypothetical protein
MGILLSILFSAGRLSDYALFSHLFVIVENQCSGVSVDSDINYMAVLIFQKWFDPRKNRYNPPDS